MKLKHIVTICLLALGLAVARAQEVKLNIPGQTDQPAPPPARQPATSEFTDAQLIEEFGWFIGKRVGLAELEFSKAELDTLLKGLAARGLGQGFALRTRENRARDGRVHAEEAAGLHRQS